MNQARGKLLFPAVIGLMFFSAALFFPQYTTGAEKASAAGKDAAVDGMVFVAGGCFEMGDTFGYGDKDEKPVHTVCVDDFYIGEHEVTQGQWKAVMGDNPSRFKDGDDYPVESVSWDDVQRFIEKFNRKTGKSYRLPTEAEWEYAAKSGGKQEKYSGTSGEVSLESYAWYLGNSGNKAHAVKQKKPNGIGVYDMSGNVWEWVGDCYGEHYYVSSPRSNPRGGSDCQFRVLRGGSWGDEQGFVRTAYRFRFEPSIRYEFDGFRLAMPASGR